MNLIKRINCSYSKFLIFIFLITSFITICNTHPFNETNFEKDRVNYEIIRTSRSSNANDDDDTSSKSSSPSTTSTTTENSSTETKITLKEYNQMIPHQILNNLHLYCGDPPLVPNAQSNVHRNQMHFMFPVGKEVNYLCEHGYKAISGNSETRCIIDGLDHSILPDIFSSQSGQNSRASSIRSKNSKRLSDIDEEPDTNSHISFSNEFNDKRKMSRKNDDVLYELEGGKKAHWFPPITLKCQLVDCPDPGQVPHAKRTDPKSGKFVFNSNVNYICEDGYETIGAPFLTCRANGTWNRSPPQCRLKQCPLLPELKNGRIAYSDSERKTNSRAEYICNSGYRLNASTNVRLCGTDDRWSLLESNIPFAKKDNTTQSNDTYSCLPVICPTPVKPHNGLRILDVNSKNRRNKKVYVMGDTIIYSCVSNRMHKTAKCGFDGEWSQEMPHCPMNEFSMMKCAPITAFSHGSFKVENNKATFTCNDGYELDGINTIKCNPNGVWSGPLPRCVIRMTLPPPYLNTTSNSSHSKDLTENESLNEHQENSISNTLLILLILISIVLFILIGIAMVAFYRWRQRRLNSKTWQRYFGHYYHRQSKTNIVLSSQFGNGHSNGPSVTIGSTRSSGPNARLLTRGRPNSKGFQKSAGYLQSSFSSADENASDLKSFTETVTSDRARTVSTYVDDTCPEDDEFDEEDEDNVSIYKPTSALPMSLIASKQHKSLPLDIVSSGNDDNCNLAAKRTLSSGNNNSNNNHNNHSNNNHIYSNLPVTTQMHPSTLIRPMEMNQSNPLHFIYNHNNGNIPVTDL